MKTAIEQDQDGPAPADDGQKNCPKPVKINFANLVHLIGFIIKIFVALQGHMSRCTVTCHDALSHIRKITQNFIFLDVIPWDVSEHYASRGDVSSSCLEYDRFGSRMRQRSF
jgi:hypothetical protein